MILQEAQFGSALYQRSLILREEILRKPIGMILREEDKALEHLEFHLVAMEGDIMFGCVLLRPLEHNTIKMRQMAVAENYQGQGIGAKLVKFAEELAKKKGFTHIECNARKTAQAFYEKLGYEVMSDEFIEVNLVTLKMGKVLA